MDTKKLRQKILDLAIRGKLVPQDPNDEPASVLLERIREEKERLIKEGKIKRDKREKDSEKSHYRKTITNYELGITNEDVPFEVPESWRWCRLGEICQIKGGKRIPLGKTFSQEQTNHIYIRVTDMKKSTILSGDLKYIDDEVYEMIKNYTISKDDLYLTIAGTIGVVGLVPPMFDGMNLTENAVKLTSISMDKNYLLHCISSQFVQEQFSSRFHQVAQPKLSIETSLKTLLPIPPLSEQKRITSAIETSFALINEIEESKFSLSQFIQQAKSKVLDLAIRGKLVPQDPSESITNYELKITKKTADIFHYPFEVPEGWVWCRFSDLYTLLSGRDLESSEFNDKNIGIPYIIGASNFNNGKLNVSRWTSSPKVISIKNDLLLTCKGTVGELTINKMGDIHIARQIMAIHPIKTIDIQYTKYCFDFFINSIKQSAKGIIPGISRNDILDMVIPLPPLPEQHRIVSKIEQIFTQLDEIEKAIKS